MILAGMHIREAPGRFRTIRNFPPGLGVAAGRAGSGEQALQQKSELTRRLTTLVYIRRRTYYPTLEYA